MQPLLRSLTAWTAVLSPVVTLIGLIQSRGWLAGLGAILASISIIALLYARYQRMRVDAASIEIEGISIDSLNAANLRRRVSRTFFIQSVHHNVTIAGADLEVEWRYAGFCKSARASGFEFSVDSSRNTPFEELFCFGYDLRADPERLHRIRPLPIGPDGLSKKIAVPFASPVQKQQPFDILLQCKMPGTYKPGLAYYTSTLSFAQERVDHCTVRLFFQGQKLDWVRVYEIDAGGAPRLIRTLSPASLAGDAIEYVDAATNRRGRSARVYLFRRTDF